MKKLTRRIKEQKVLNGLKTMIREQKLNEVLSRDAMNRMGQNISVKDFDQLDHTVQNIIDSLRSDGFEGDDIKFYLVMLVSNIVKNYR